MVKDMYMKWSQPVKIMEIFGGGNLVEIGLSTSHRHLINDTAVDILEQINGEKTYDEIIEIMSKKYTTESVQQIEEYLEEFINELEQTFDLAVEYMVSPSLFSVEYERSNMVLPTVATLEITNRCNLKCKHCYGNYGNDNQNEMSYASVINALDNFSQNGIAVLELTGGDITVHKDIYEIIQYALTLDFHKIILLTNGIALKEKLLDLIIENKQRIVVQIDLHSLNDDYLQWFSGMAHTLKIIKHNITTLTKNNVFVRVVTIATPKNINELESISAWCHNHNVREWGVSPVLNYGRAQVNSDLMFESVEQIQTFIYHLDKAYNDTNGELEIEHNTSNKHNCGCLTSHMVVNVDGDIKLCAMDNMLSKPTGYGNVLKDSISKIYSDRSDFFTAFASLDAPSKTSGACKACDRKDHCHGCFVRALQTEEASNGTCLWCEKEFNRII